MGRYRDNAYGKGTKNINVKVQNKGMSWRSNYTKGTKQAY